MAYDTGNPPHLRGDQPVAAPRQWAYRSTHTQAEVGTSDFINNGSAIGMAVGDSIFNYGSTTYLVSHHAIRALGSTFVTLSAGHLISSAS
jgi:hypothetical protein